MSKQFISYLTILTIAACLSWSASSGYADSFGTTGNKFIIDFVNIGNAGNAADTTGDPNPAGSVGYAYRMGTYEISQAMIDKATASGLTGVVAGAHAGDKPAANVSWFEAAKFVNWLNRNRGHQAAYNFESGNFQLWSSAEAWQLDGENLFRHKDAQYFLPSADEWYKAAYHDATAGTGGTYFNFPTGSDIAPTAVASGTTSGTAVYNQQIFVTDPADIMDAGGLSPYGTMGQGGNVWEWEETEFDLVNDSLGSSRGVRGGSWINLYVDNLSASFRFGIESLTSGGIGFGFRVASIPEPATMFLLVFGYAAVLGCRKRRRA